MKRPNTSTLLITNIQRQPVQEAEIWIRPYEGDLFSQIVPKEIFPERGLYILPPLPRGIYLLKIKAGDLQNDQVYLDLRTGFAQVIAILGKKNTRYYYQGQTKVYFESDERELGVILSKVDVTIDDASRSKMMKQSEIRMKVEEKEEGQEIQKVKYLGRKSKKQQKEFCEMVQRIPEVQMAGPIIRNSNNKLGILNGELYVKLEKGYTRQDLEQNIEKLPLKIYEEDLSERGWFYLSHETPGSFKALDDMNQVATSSGVEIATPGTILGQDGLAALGQKFSSDFLHPAQYYLKTMGVPRAWKLLEDDPDINFAYGDGNIIVGVDDSGIITGANGTTISHQEFNTDVQGGDLINPPTPNPKVYYSFDYRTTGNISTVADRKKMKIGNDDQTLPHGTNVSGVILAKQDNDGVVGIAPNTRLFSIKSFADATSYPIVLNFKVRHYRNAFLHFSGFDPVWPGTLPYINGQQFPKNFNTPGLRSAPNQLASIAIPNGSGISIINQSYRSNLHHNQSMINAYIKASKYGRKRLGLLSFAASANTDAPFRNNSSLGSDNRTMMVSASTMDHKGREIRAQYSAFAIDLDPGIDFCAPSKFSQFGTPSPPLSKGVTTSSFKNKSEITLNNLRIRSFKLAANVSAGSSLVKSKTINFFSPGLTVFTLALLKSAPNVNISKSDWISIKALHPSGDVDLNYPILNDYKEDDELIFFYFTVDDKGTPNLDDDTYIFDGDYTLGFGGTSAACPMAAGLAALIISAKPQLNWMEVRDIMRRTAVPIDIRNRGPRPQNITDSALEYKDSSGKTIDKTDLNWIELKKGKPPGDSTDAKPLLTDLGLLDLNGNPSFPSKDPPVYPSDNNDYPEYKINLNTLTSNGSAHFTARKAILIGAETFLSNGAASSATSIDVDDVSGFAVGDQLIIGRDTETILIGNSNLRKLGDSLGPGEHLDVLNTDGFQSDDQLIIELKSGSVNREIDNFGGNGDINSGFAGGSSRINLKSDITLQFDDIGQTVRLVKTETKTITNITGNQISFAPSTLSNTYPTNTIVKKEHTEIRVIKSVTTNSSGETILTVDPFEHDHTAVVRVTPGRRADYSYLFGYGRLDAAAAVDAALKFHQEDHADLMIRNFMTDNGQANTVAPIGIQSPDIWLRNADDLSGTVYNNQDAPPHQNPKLNAFIQHFKGNVAHNDLLIKSVYTGTLVAEFKISTDGAGNFSWTKDDGTPSTLSIVPNTPIDINGELDIQFSTTAYDGTEEWILTAIPPTDPAFNRYLYVRVHNAGNKDSYESTNFEGDPFNNVRCFLSLSNGLPIVRFLSSDLDDLEVTSAYTGTSLSLFTIRINDDTNPNKFNWSQDGVEQATNVPITGMEQVLADGVKIKFKQINGHTKDDQWEIRARPNGEQFNTLDDYILANPSSSSFNLSVNKAGTLLLDDVALDQSIDHSGSGSLSKNLEAGQSRVFKFDWLHTHLPELNPLNATVPSHPLRLFALAEVVPHDGILGGDTADKNNNISFRELIFARMEARNETADLPLPISIDVDKDGNDLTTKFTLNFFADIGSFDTEQVVLKFTRIPDDASLPPEVLTFRHDGTNWGFTEPTPHWTSIKNNEPILFATNTTATGRQVAISFAGDFTANKVYKKISIQGQLNTIPVLPVGSAAVELASYYHEIVVLDTSLDIELPQDSSMAKGSKRSKFDFFTVYKKEVSLAETNTNIVLLPQTDPTKAFGPLSSTSFNTTSLHTLSNDASAFAVTDGFIIAQENTENPNLVNLILQPRTQGAVAGLNVSYFVYRGIKRSSLFNGNNIAVASKNDLTQQIWDTNQTLYEEDGNTGLAPVPEAKVLGLDLSTSKTDQDLLREGFVRTADTYKRPFVNRGMAIGEFAAAGTPGKGIGFDIILDEFNYEPSFGEVRAGQNLIQVNNSLSTLVLQNARKKILNFFDPAAFYGMHLFARVFAHDSINDIDKMRKKELYEDLLEKFYNKDAIYLDIRNDQGFPLNFYGNYGNDIKVRLKEDNNTNLVNQLYEWQDWPIKVFRTSDFDIDFSDNNGRKNAVRFSLPEGDNGSPLVFLAMGSDYRRFPRLQKHKKRFFDLTVTGGWTEEIHLGVPNIRGNNDTTPSSWYLKLYYLKRAADTTPSGTPSVLPTNHHLDQVFLPKALPSFFENSDDIHFMANLRQVFIDGATTLGFSSMAETGISMEAGRVTFFAIPKQVLSSRKGGSNLYKEILGGSSNAASFFDIVQNKLPDLKLRKREIKISTSTTVNYLEFAEADSNKHAKSNAFNFIGLSMSKAEYDTLTASVAPLDESLHPVTLNVRSVNTASDLDQNGYQELVIGAAGLNANGDYTELSPTITAYSGNGIFASTHDAAALENVPISSGGEGDLTFYDNEGKIQVYKRVKYFEEEDKVRWELVDINGNIQTYGSNEEDYWGNNISGDNIELPAGTRVVWLEKKKIASREYKGSMLHYRIVCYYRKGYREGYIHENAFKDHTSISRVHASEIDHLSYEELIEAFVNDAYFEVKMLKDLFVDHNAATSHPKLKKLLDSVEKNLLEVIEGVAGLSGAIYIPVYRYRICKMVEEIPIQSKEENIPSQIEKFITHPTIQELKEHSKWVVYSTTPNSKITELLEEKDDDFPLVSMGVPNGDPGEVLDNIPFQGITDIEKVKTELLDLKGFIDQLNNSLGVEIKASSDYQYLKKITASANTSNPAITTVHEMTVIILLAVRSWQNEVQEKRLMRSSIVPVDQSFGHIDSDHIFSILINELNVGSSFLTPTDIYPTKVLKMITDTHRKSAGGSYLSEIAWDVMRTGIAINDLYSNLPSDAITGGVNPARTIMELFFRNPEIGMIYLDHELKEILNKN